MNKKQIAFTLVELLVVVSVIIILFGIGLASTKALKTRAKITKDQVFSDSLRNNLAPNLVAEWNFDGSGRNDGQTATAGYIKDSWASYDGTLDSGHEPIVRTGNNCAKGSCLEFNSNSYAYFTGDYAFNNTNSVTIETWINPSQYSSNEENYDPIIGYSDSYQLWQYYSSGTATFVWEVNYDYDNGIRRFMDMTADLLPINQWTYVVLTYDNGSLKAYKNTALFSSADVEAIDFPQSTGNFSMGMPSAIGRIDETRVYNVKLPAYQMQKDYIAGLDNLLAAGSITKEEYASRISELATK